MIAQGALGQKTKGRIYRKEDKTILVLDPQKGEYRPAIGEVAPEVEAILAQRDPRLKFEQLRASSHRQAQFLWAIFRDLFHYCAYHLGEIADNAGDVDLAMRLGFGWAMGPFETWQAASWTDLAKTIAEEIANGQTMASVALPDAAGQYAGRGVHQRIQLPRRDGACACPLRRGGGNGYERIDQMAPGDRASRVLLLPCAHRFVRQGSRVDTSWPETIGTIFTACSATDKFAEAMAVFLEKGVSRLLW